MWHDMMRRCDFEDIPFRKPSVFPRNGLLAARVAFAAKDEAWMPEFAKAVFKSNFVGDEDISDEAVIGRILADLGESDAWIEDSKAPENEAGLKRRTERATALGMFGAPSFVAEDGELFWGDDRMEDAFEWVSEARP